LSNRFDHSTTATTYLVNSPATDPAKSPTVQPRDITDSHSHTWTQACLYTVKARSVDDDTGNASDQVPLVVQGNAALVYGPGWWYQNYRTGNPKINATTAQCYLDIVGQMSRVYQEQYDASTTAGAKNYLGTSGQNDPGGSLARRSWRPGSTSPMAHCTGPSRSTRTATGSTTRRSARSCIRSRTCS
jgi:hypothetical protein